MSSLNSCTFTGRVGKDPEKRMTGGGTKIAQFSLAVDGRKRDDDTLWLECVAFGKSAEVIARYCQKGREVAVQGRLNVRKWQGRDGATRTSVELAIAEFALIGSKPQSSGGDGWGNPQQEPEGGWDQAAPSNVPPEQVPDPWNHPEQTQPPASAGW